MSQESSLTAPWDRDLKNKWIPNQTVQVLTTEELKVASKELNVNITKYVATDRVYCDPSINMQNIALISFVPSKGSTPDKHGVYGFCKIRGVFNTDMEADERADFIIRNIDSYHPIFHAPVGRPIPMTVKNTFSGDHKEVDLQKQASESVSQSVKTERDKEKKDMMEIKDREKKLRQDVARTSVDPLDHYIELKVKKAQLVWTFYNSQKKMDEIKTILRKTVTEITNMNVENPEHESMYYEKYKAARDEAGLDLGPESNTQDNFMKYLVDDIPLDFLKD